MNEVGTLKKGLDILWLIIERGDLSVLEIMDKLQFNRSTTYRLINTLEQNQFIQKTAEANYVVSDRLVDKLTALDNNLNFDLNLSIVRAADEFKKLTKETIFVGALSGSQVIATYIIPGSYPTRTHYEVGAKLPAQSSAAGKSILAFQSSKLLEVFKNEVDSEFHRNFRKFSEELEQVKKVGYAIDNEEAEAGVRCIAAPIWRNEKVIASIAITGPSTRMSKEMDDVNSNLVKLLSQRITENLEHPRSGEFHHA